MPKAVLRVIKQPPTVWQRLNAGLTAPRLAKLDPPPSTPEAIEQYYAALAEKTPDLSLLPLARALLWADLKARQFHSLCASWYPLVAETYPDDERCAFYVAALYHHRLIPIDKEQQERFLGALMKGTWRDSTYWNKLDLPRQELLRRLTDSLQAEEIRITPERIPVLEAAFDTVSLSEEQRLTTARWLAVAYRASGRSDDRAEIIFRYLFVHDPDDRENNQYLANLFAGRELDDSNACAVYLRVVSDAERANDQPTLWRWSQRLARTYIAQNRLGAEAIRPLQLALANNPGDRLLEAALAYSIARSEALVVDAVLLKHLEMAIAFEPELLPYFIERRWQWAIVPRALALAWGQQGRSDSLAAFIFSRATELCPEEKTLWGYHARILLQEENFSRKAITVYEKANHYKQADASLVAALAKAYCQNRVQDAGGSERRKAMALWEELYRKGEATDEIVDALTESYLSEERLNEIALELLQKIAQQRTNLQGPLLLRLAHEWRERGDFTTALRWYQEAERALPGHFPTLFEYGLLLKEQFSDFTGAVNVLARAVILPAGIKSLPAHLALAECLLALDKREEARKVFQLIVERIDPNHTSTLLHLARLNLKYEEQGMLRAENYYERVASLAPSDPETYRQLADLYRAQGNTHQEQWALEQYLKVGPLDPKRLKDLADLYLRRGDFEKSESTLRQIIGLGHGDKAIFKQLGDVMQQRQNAS